MTILIIGIIFSLDDVGLIELEGHMSMLSYACGRMEYKLVVRMVAIVLSEAFLLMVLAVPFCLTDED
jgi:hypothetical protein